MSPHLTRHPSTCRVFALMFGASAGLFVIAVENLPAWDGTREARWGAAYSRVGITFTADGSLQLGTSCFLF